MASIGKLLLIMTMVYLFQYTDRDRYLTNLNFLVPIHTKDDTTRTFGKLYVKMFRLRPLGVFFVWELCEFVINFVHANILKLE